MEKDFNYVYVTTCLINNKQYVGSHCTNNIDDDYIGSGRLFLKAVRKYGKKNFKRKIIEECENVIQAREKEGPLIKKINTLDPFGYNLSPKGGIGFKGAFHSESTKEKQRVWQKGKTYEELYGVEKAAEMKRKQREKKLGKSTSRKGKNMKTVFTEKYGEKEGLQKYNEFINKQSVSHKDLIPWIKGKSHTLESRQKMSKKLSGKNHPMWNKTLSKETRNKIAIGNKKSFYKKLNNDKLMIIKKLFEENNTYVTMTKQTNYNINKLKRIIKEKIWEK